MSIFMVSFYEQFNLTFTEHTCGPGCGLDYTAGRKDGRRKPAMWYMVKIFCIYGIPYSENKPARASLVAQMVKNLSVMHETWVQSLGQEDSLKKGMTTHSSILA